MAAGINVFGNQFSVVCERQGRQQASGYRQQERHFVYCYRWSVAFHRQPTVFFPVTCRLLGPIVQNFGYLLVNGIQCAEPVYFMCQAHRGIIFYQWFG